MENDRKRKNMGFFVKLTLKESKEKIAAKEKTLKRKLTKEEKEKIMQNVARRTKRRTVRNALFAGIAGLTIFGGGAKLVKALNPGDSPSIETTKEETKNDANKDFRENMSVDESEYIYQNEEEKEIKEIENADDALNYFKNMYIEEYEKETGNDKLTTEDIKISLSSQNYIYVLDDGTIVTHGNFPYNTEDAIKTDGHSYTSEQDKKVYEIILKENNKIIDACIHKNEEMQRVIPGDNYSEMKDYESILSKFGPITSDIYKLIDAYNSSSKNISAIKEKLLNHVNDYKNNNKDVNQIEQNNDGEEIGE